MYIDFKTTKDTAYITMKRKDKANSLNEDFLDEFLFKINEIKTLKSIKCVILKAEGKNFCTGFDIDWLKETTNKSLNNLEHTLAKLEQLLIAIKSLPIIKIAKTHGYVMGAGIGIIACCDIIIADETTVIKLPELDHEIVPAIIWPHLVKLIGETRAKYYTITREVIPAITALSIGLVSVVIESSKVEDLISSILNKVSKNNILTINSLINIDTANPSNLLANLLKQKS